MALFLFDDVGVEGSEGTILRGVSLNVPASGITVVIGPSGAGKSTLLRLMNRLEVPSSGTIQFRDTALSGLDPLVLRRRVGMVFQRPALFGGTVRDNLAVAAPDASDAEYASALERAELPAAFLDRDAGTLSGGEAQRVCLARTLVTGPEVLLMDEPTSALDERPRLALERLTQGLARGGVPVVWVTHQLEQMRRLADVVVVLIAGRVCYSGAPDGLGGCEDPLVAGFLGGDDAGFLGGDDAGG